MYILIYFFDLNTAANKTIGFSFQAKFRSFNLALRQAGFKIIFMRSFYLVLVTIFISSTSEGQLNLRLKKELDSIYAEDQRYRELLFSDQLKGKADSIAAFYKVDKKDLVNYLMTAMQKADSSNIIRVGEIIKQHGYPGKTLVGQPTNQAAFFVLQHSQSIDQYLSIVKKAAEQEELLFSLYAMMLDRSLMYNGKEQIYGTQAKGIQVTDPQTGKKVFKMIIWPVQDPKSVNALRKEAGFKETIEENAKRLDVYYEPLTLKQVKEMQEK